MELVVTVVGWLVHLSTPTTRIMSILALPEVFTGYLFGSPTIDTIVTVRATGAVRAIGTVFTIVAIEAEGAASATVATGTRHTVQQDLATGTTGTLVAIVANVATVTIDTVVATGAAGAIGTVVAVLTPGTLDAIDVTVRVGQLFGEYVITAGVQGLRVTCYMDSYQVHVFGFIEGKAAFRVVIF